MGFLGEGDMELILEDNFVERSRRSEGERKI